MLSDKIGGLSKTVGKCLASAVNVFNLRMQSDPKPTQMAYLKTISVAVSSRCLATDIFIGV